MSPLATLNGMAVLEHLTSGALVTDATGQILYINPELSRLAGILPDQAQGQSIASLLQSNRDCAFCLGASKGSNPELAAFHGAMLQTIRADGASESLKVKVKHSQLNNNLLLCLIDPFSEDTTLTQAHSDFVSTVSHEFRTPLTSIKGFADTLLQYGQQLPEEEKRRFINIIKDQADRLIRLVENLLTASRLGAGRVELSYRCIPLKKMLEKVAQSIQAKALSKTQTERQFNILLNPPTLEVWADADRLEQVLINLIDNAVKYSPATSTVHIKAEFLPEDDSLIRITIRDEGQGIPPELLPRLFTKFYRVESPLKQDVEGTGLGLYITKSLTTSMGGQISVESTPGEGCMFTVLFPAATPERQAMHRRRLYAGEEDA